MSDKEEYNGKKKLYPMNYSVALILWAFHMKILREWDAIGL